MPDLFRGLGPSEEWPSILGNVAKTLGVDPTPPPKPDLHIPEVYLDFFSRAPAFVIVAFCGRHPLAAASDIDGKLRAWRRICGQVSGVYVIRSGFAANRRMLLALFPPNFVIELVIADCLSLRGPRLRRNYLRCG